MGKLSGGQKKGTGSQRQERATQDLAERLCCQVARRDDSHIARRLYSKQVVEGVYRLDEWALLDDFFHS